MDKNIEFKLHCYIKSLEVLIMMVCRQGSCNRDVLLCSWQYLQSH